MSEWRLLVTRLNGDGTETIQDFDLPGTQPSITHVLNGGAEISVDLKPQFAHLIDEQGKLTLRRWKSAVYLEEDGQIVAGGIYVDGLYDPTTSAINLDIMGFASYPAGMPYTGSWTATNIDPLDVFRHIWDHLQGQPGGNLGVVVDPLKSDKRIGKTVAQGVYDTENGPLAFEYEPVSLRWWETHDLGEYISNLSEGTPFDFMEEHRWNADRTAIEHRIRLGYPTLGRVRDDVRMVAGENIVMPKLAASEQEYASEVLALGAGEGAAMLRAVVHRAGEDRIRRVAVLEEKAANTAQAINAAGQAEVRQRTGADRIVEIETLPSADELHSLVPGDLCMLLGTLADVRGTQSYVQKQTVSLSEIIASFNINGNLSTPHPLSGRLSRIADRIIASHASIVLLQEANSDRDQPQDVVKALKAKGADYWRHHKTLNLNSILVDMRVWDTEGGLVANKSLGKGTNADPMTRYASSLNLTHRVTGAKLATWNVHSISGPDNDNTRLRHAKVTTPWLGALGRPTIGGGDMNSWQEGTGTPLKWFDKNGFTETRKLVSSVTNGQYESAPGYGTPKTNSRWLDHLFATPGVKPTAVGLILPDGASDHSLIWTRFEMSYVVDNVVERGIDNWVKIVSKTTSPEAGTVSFQVSVPDTI